MYTVLQENVIDGKLLTDCLRSLTKGITAIETHLGCTLSGKTLN